MFITGRSTIPTGDDLDISLDKAGIIAIFIEAIMFGIEALVFVSAVYLLHGAKHTRTLLFKFSTVITMFLLNTIYMGSSLRRLLNAFIGNPHDELIPDPAGYLADLTGFLYRFQTIIIIVQFIMLDVLVAYRCYMIWGRRLVVTIIPSIGILAYLVTGIAAIHAFATYTSDTVFTGITMKWVSATFSITLFTKLACFVTIITGTRWHRSNGSWRTEYLKGAQKRLVYKTVLLGIETGFLAVIGSLVLVPVYLAGQNAQSIVLDAMSPLTGLSFLLIIIAALLGFTPSMSGPSRRRRAGHFPQHHVSVPPMSFGPVHATHRFSGTSVFTSAKALDMKEPVSPSSGSGSSLATSEPSTKSDLARIAPFAHGTDTVPARSAEPAAQLPYSSTFGRPTKTLNTLDTLACATMEIEPAAAIPTSGTPHIASSVDGSVDVLR
ncbi:hypothetical protein BU17DRAFT_81533 [Hysterangium stoloniferum]|nr:hypothetical protein BU17DRAFT_81533 [Hysterangium stoloniferum]